MLDYDGDDFQDVFGIAFEVWELRNVQIDFHFLSCALLICRKNVIGFDFWLEDEVWQIVLFERGEQVLHNVVFVMMGKDFVYLQITREAYGMVRTIELIPNGTHINVTQENK